MVRATGNLGGWVALGLLATLAQPVPARAGGVAPEGVGARGVGRAPAPKRVRPKRGRPAPAARTLPVQGQVPDFSYLDQDGQRVTLADLKGHIWLADFIYTRCTSACPVMSARMVQLQRRITDPRARFVSFSIDPEHDTPAALKTYASHWTVDESRWRLLSTDKASLPLFSARMAAAVQETGDPSDPIDHSRGFLLIDAQGGIRGLYDSSDVDHLNQLLEDFELLAKAPLPEPASEAKPDGKVLYVALGCQGCHGQAKIASPLGGLFGRTVKLDDGRTLKADEEYVRESIVAPEAKVVAGYPATMPSYAGQLTEAQLAALLAYLKALPAEAQAPAARQLVVDPVCKMEISAGPDTLHAEHGGKTYHFCSDECLQRFKKAPAAFVRP